MFLNNDDGDDDDDDDSVDDDELNLKDWSLILTMNPFRVSQIETTPALTWFPVYDFE